MTEAALMLLEGKNPIEFFTPKGLDPIIDKIREEVASRCLEISTDKGRKEIASLARKIASSKVKLDEMGKDLVTGLKAQTGAIDAERKRMRDELDKLRDDTRRPLTEWEQKDGDRIAAHEKDLAAIEASATFQTEPNSADVQERIDWIQRRENKDWEEFAARAELAKETALRVLSGKLETVKQAEVQKAELERLRKAEQERIQKDREERLKAEAAAKAKAEAEARAKAEADALAAKVKAEAEKAEKERLRIERERNEAEGRARKAEADRIAAEEKAKADAIAAEERAKAAQAASARKAEEDRIAAEAKAKREIEAAAQRERDRIEAEKRAEAEATAKREADKQHKARINNEALKAFVASGLTEELGMAAVKAIASNQIPHVKIVY